MVLILNQERKCFNFERGISSLFPFPWYKWKCIENNLKANILNLSQNLIYILKRCIIMVQEMKLFSQSKFIVWYIKHLQNWPRKVIIQSGTESWNKNRWKQATGKGWCIYPPSIKISQISVVCDRSTTIFQFSFDKCTSEYLYILFMSEICSREEKYL